MKLILPVAGKSSRYPNIRPKWLLTLSDGSLMIEKSLSGISKKNINEIVIIMLEDHYKFISQDQLEELISSKISNNIKLKIIALEESTNSQPSTIASYLNSIEEDFSFFIKDSDNYFELEPINLNLISYVDLANVNNLNVNNKSYVQTNRFNEAEKIVEKKVISDKFCCGGYGFKSSFTFLNSFNELGGNDNSDLYISHIIQKQLIEGETFNVIEASNYEDYGTYEDYKKYMSRTKSFFCDFDGVLVINSSKFDLPPWQYKPLKNNLYKLKEFLEKSPHSKFIITTSRPEKEKKNIKKFLKDYGIDCHEIVSDLPHSSRILINDFAKSNPYPSAESINLSRNSDDLSAFL